MNEPVYSRPATPDDERFVRMVQEGQLKLIPLPPGPITFNTDPILPGPDPKPARSDG